MAMELGHCSVEAESSTVITAVFSLTKGSRRISDYNIRSSIFLENLKIHDVGPQYEPENFERSLNAPRFVTNQKL